MQPLTGHRGPRCAWIRVLATLLLLCTGGVRPSAAAGTEPPADEALERALQTRAVCRARVEPAHPQTEDTWQRLDYRGRPTLEISGRTAPAAGPATLLDLTLFDLAAGRPSAYVYFPHASTRKSGEPIISLSEVSQRADALVRGLLPGTELLLESIERYRESGGDRVYYEARYAAQGTALPFLQPPVRLLLEAVSGRLFRFDVEPALFDPPAAPARKISRQQAERIAAVALGRPVLGQVFGEGARVASVATAELFNVRPNDWLGFFAEGSGAPVRVAWVVPFHLADAPAGEVHSLFVDAASGRLLGGVSGRR